MKRLVQARHDRKLTQRDVVKALHWHQPAIARMESGRRRVDVIELAALAKLYRKPLQWFVPPV